MADIEDQLDVENLDIDKLKLDLKTALRNLEQMDQELDKDLGIDQNGNG